MREADGADRPGSSPSRAAYGSSSSSGGRVSAANGSSNGTGARNGMSPQSNGTSSKKPIQPTSTFYGHDREEVTRILIQGLSDLGYEAAAASLSRESGFDLETPYASAFRMAILQGDWVEAETLLTGQEQEDSGGGSSLETQQQEGRRIHGLALSADADPGEMLFLIRQQKYLELLEIRDLGAALMVLRQQLQPLHQDERQLHALSSLIMCQSSDDLKFQANWDGALGESRRRLLSSLSRFISPSVMIPEHRLAELLTQVKENQVLNCPHHNTPKWPSLYMDHSCEREDFPLESLCELDRHSNEVWYLKFSNDGTRLATASKDSTVVIYDTTTFKPVHILEEHRDPVAYVAWSPDDKSLVSCSQDKTARLWDTKTGTCKLVLKYHTEPVTSATWAPDGMSFVTGSLDLKNPLVVWGVDLNKPDVTPNTPLHNFENLGTRVQDCAIASISSWTSSLLPPPEQETLSSSDSVRLVAACTDRSIHVFDYVRREKLSQVSLEHEITCLNLSGTGHEMLVNLSCNEVWALSVESGEVIQKYRGQHQGKYVIRSCFGGATEGVIASGGEDARISIWHRYSGRLLEQLDGHRAGCVNSVAWNSKIPSMFASAGDDTKVRIWSNSATVRLREVQQSSVQSSSETEPATQSQQQELPRWGRNGDGAAASTSTSGASAESPTGQAALMRR